MGADAGRGVDALVVHPDMSMMGGGEVVCLLTLASLIREGCRAILASSDVSDANLRMLFASNGLDGVPRVRLRVLRGPLATYPNLVSLGHQMRIIRDIRPRCLIHTQVLLPDGARKEVERRVAYVYFPYMRETESTRESTFRGCYLGPARLWTESALRKLDAIACVSYFTKRAIQRAWEHLSIPEPKVVYPSTLNTFSPNFGWDQRKKQVVYVARFSRFKRHELLKQMAERAPNVEFYSVGSLGPNYAAYFGFLQHKKPPNYHVMPNASVEVIRTLLEQSRIYAHPAIGEHFGIAPLEAMNAGCVPLVHASGGTGEVVPEALRWKTDSEFQDLLTTYLEDRDEWTRWHNAVTKTAQVFSPKRFMDQMRGLIE